MSLLREPGLSTATVGRTLERPPAARSAADVVHRRLRDEILSLAREPGATISEKDIAVAHGVSRTPVREALLRLAEERLVEIAPKSGTRVSRIPISALADAMCAREALELMLVRMAAERARPSTVTGMRAIIEHQRECIASGGAAEFHAADEALHLAIAEAAAHPGIWAMVLQIKVQLDRVRHLTLPRPGRIAHVVEEHEEIVEAIAAHDPDRAGRTMHAHIVSLKEALGEIRNANPDYFVGDVGDLIF